MTVEMSDREVRAGTLRIRTHHDGSIWTVALAGELDLASAKELSEELEWAEIGGDAPRRLVLDMTELEFIDSTGIAILVAANRRFNADGDCFSLVPSRAEIVCRVLAMTGMGASLPFLPQQ